MESLQLETMPEKQPKKVVIMKKDHKPIIVKGKNLVQTWWGKAWNVNLERYADCYNRIDRGRSYVRHGAVVDLKIGYGVVKALVQGRTDKPYSVTIRVEELRKDIWHNMIKSCEGRLSSLSDFLEGDFPPELAEIFTNPGSGMFPSFREIEFSCGCPDWANMCKHVAATLYGVGVRIDESPGKLFKLRRVNVAELVSKAVEDRSRTLLEKAEQSRSKVIDYAEIKHVFNIDMEDDIDLGKIFESSFDEGNKGDDMEFENDQYDQPKTGNNPDSEIQHEKPETLRRAKPGKKFNFDAFMKYFLDYYDIPTGEDMESIHIKLDRIERMLLSSDPTEIPRRKSRTQSKSAIDTVMDVIEESEDGLTVADIEEKTGFDVIKVRNVIFRLHKMDKIKRLARGVYVPA